MRPAGLLAIQCIGAHQLGQFQEVGDSSGPLQCLVELHSRTRHRQVVPELRAQLTDLVERLGQRCCRPLDTTTSVHDLAEPAMKLGCRLLTVDPQQRRGALLHPRDRIAHAGIGGCRQRSAEQRIQVVGKGERQGEPAIDAGREQRIGAQPVRAVIAPADLPADEEPRQRRHLVEVAPQPAHGEMRTRRYSHPDAVGILTGGPLIHLEEVAVALRDGLASERFQGIGEVEIDRVRQRSDAVSRVDLLLGRPR